MGNIVASAGGGGGGGDGDEDFNQPDEVKVADDSGKNGPSEVQ